MELALFFLLAWLVIGFLVGTTVGHVIRKINRP